MDTSYENDDIPGSGQVEVSVIVPCFNHGRYLDECIESVASQIGVHLECIIVDDGSTDDSRQIAEALARRFQFVRVLSKCNGGLSSARNAGIRVSSGKFLLFLDADDRLSPSALSVLTAKATSSGSDIVFGGYLRFKLNPFADWYAATAPSPVDKPLRSFLHENRFPVHSALIRADFARAIGSFDEELTSCEDWDYWLRGCLVGANIAYIPEIVAYYRVLDKSMSSNRERMLVNRIRVFLKVAKQIECSVVLKSVYSRDTYAVASRLRKRLCIIAYSDTQRQLLSELRLVQHQFIETSNLTTKSKLKLLLDRKAPLFCDAAFAFYTRYFAKHRFRELVREII